MIDLLVFFGIIMVGALPCAVYALPRITGRRRAWVNRGGLGASPEGNWWTLKQNNVPFGVAAIGAAWVLIWSAVWAEDAFPALESMAWMVQILSCVLALWTFTFGWPLALTPSWYRDWLARGGRTDPGETSPWPR